MSEYQRTGEVTESAMKAGMSRPTARKYLAAGQPPPQLQVKHTWRTRPDPLVPIWPRAEAMLREAPELEAKGLLEHLLGHPVDGVIGIPLRTFQRRVRHWRLQHGPDREVYFPQDWVPGRVMQLDWTHAEELGIRIGGRSYEHKSRVLVEGVGKVKRHTRANPQRNIKGGILERENWIHVSNVLPIDPDSDKPTRVGVRVERDGNRVRVAKRSGKALDK